MGGFAMVFTADAASGGSRWPLVRIGVGATCEVISLSHKMLPLSVHWTGQSTVCAVQDCDLCALLPVRGVYYLPVICPGAILMRRCSNTSGAYSRCVGYVTRSLRPGCERASNQLRPHDDLKLALRSILWL